MKMQVNKEFDLIVQDNSSLKPDLPSNIKEIIDNNKNFSFLHKKLNGLSASRNFCISKCKTKYIHFLDDDTHCPAVFTNNLLNVLSSSDFSCIGGRVIADWSMSKRPEWLTENCLPYLSVVDHGSYQIENPRYLVGANLCFKTKDLISIGGFQENLGRIANKECLLSNEESLAIEILKTTNKKVVYDPSFPVYHYMKKDRLTKSWLIKRAAWQAVSDLISGNDLAYNQQDGFLKKSIFTIFSDLNPNIDILLYSVRYLIYKLLKGCLN